MSARLKDQYRLQIAMLVAANALMYLGVVGLPLWLDVDTLDVARLGSLAASGSGALAITAVINGLITPTGKARIVFFRWNDPLPGSRAFSQYVHCDERINLDALQLQVGELPKSPRKQNELWYRLYKAHDEDASIQGVHRDFLFTRDFTAIALLLLLGLGSCAFMQMTNSTVTFLYWCFLGIQFFVFQLASKNYAERFVCTVLAVASAKQVATA